jgi:hypothetical protein
MTMDTVSKLKISDFNKEKIAELYFGSLENNLTRKNHVLLGLEVIGNSTANPKQTSIPPHPPTPNDVRADFTAWYGGFLTLAQMIDPGGGTLPTTETMTDYVSKNFDRAKAAIAA